MTAGEGTWRLAYFVSTDSQPRVRRASDVFKVGGGLALAIFGIIGMETHPPWETALTELLASMPAWLATMLDLGFVLGLLYLVALVVALAVSGPERREALRDLLVASVCGVLLASIATRIITGTWPYIVPGFGLEEAQPRFPVMRLVLITAALVAVSPHLSRPMRRLGWQLITISAVAAIAFGYGQPSDAVGGLGIGLLAAGSTLLIFGSPRGYPDPAVVANALRQLGLPVREAWIDVEQSWGVRRLSGRLEDDTVVAIKAYGRDASDSQLLAKAWRSLWYREHGETIVRSRLQAVEHEALVTMLAQRAGVSVPSVLAAGQATSEVAVLVVSGSGRGFVARPSDETSDEELVAIWNDLARLHAAGISHGALTIGAIEVEREGHTIGDFALGSLGATQERRSMDVVELLFSMSMWVGPERTVRTASIGLGDDALVSALPYLQLPAVSAASRHAAKKPKQLIAGLQAAVVDVAGQPLPEPVALRRIEVRSLVTAGLLLFTAGALIPLFSGLDYEAVWGVLKTAEWSLVAFALVIGQASLITEAIGVTFAVAHTSLPFWPLVTLQSAVKFVSLAVPGAAGRIVMSAGFLHKFGISLSMSTTQGAIDTFTGFLVEAIILLVAVLSTDFALDATNVDIEWRVVLIVLLVVALATVVAVRRVRWLRLKVLPAVHEGWGALVAVVREPTRAFGLLGSNLATRLILAATLWLVLDALHAPLGLGATLAVVVATNLLAGFVPVPGGIGVAEAALTAFMVAFGVDETVAFAAALTYRAITFYLPAIVGYPSMRWLERNGYL